MSKKASVLRSALSLPGKLAVALLHGLESRAVPELGKFLVRGLFSQIGLRLLLVLPPRVLIAEGMIAQPVRRRPDRPCACLRPVFYRFVFMDSSLFGTLSFGSLSFASLYFSSATVTPASPSP